MQIFLVHRKGWQLVINKQKQKLIINKSKINIKKKILIDCGYWKPPLEAVITYSCKIKNQKPKGED